MLGLKMSSSVCGFACLAVMLCVFSQVHPMCIMPWLRSSGSVMPTCCVQTSNATINQRVDKCFIQNKTTFNQCNVDAVIFANNKFTWCVDPRAWWVPQRLKKLAERQICCQIL